MGTARDHDPRDLGDRDGRRAPDAEQPALDHVDELHVGIDGDGNPPAGHGDDDRNEGAEQDEDARQVVALEDRDRDGPRGEPGPWRGRTVGEERARRVGAKAVRTIWSGRSGDREGRGPCPGPGGLVSGFREDVAAFDGNAVDENPVGAAPTRPVAGSGADVRRVEDGARERVTRVEQPLEGRGRPPAGDPGWRGESVSVLNGAELVVVRARPRRRADDDGGHPPVEPCPVGDRKGDGDREEERTDAGSRPVPGVGASEPGRRARRQSAVGRVARRRRPGERHGLAPAKRRRGRSPRWRMVSRDFSSRRAARFTRKTEVMPRREQQPNRGRGRGAQRQPLRADVITTGSSGASLAKGPCAPVRTAPMRSTTSIPAVTLPKTV